MKRIFFIPVAGLALFISACVHREAGSETVRIVKTDIVRVYGEKLSVTFPGKVKAASDVKLAFRVSGPIAKIHVGEGNRVRKGQVLAEMDPRDYLIQLEATEAEYRQVKAEAERIIALYEKNGVTANVHDKAVYGLQQIAAKYESHRNALADVRLCAPFDGYVQKCLFGANETVGAGTPVISMISTGVPEVEINIPSSDFVRRDRFDSFTCTVDIYPDREFPLELVGVTRKANLSQLYAMRLRIREAAEQMPAPGMAAMVNIVLKPEGMATVNIPLTALFELNGVSTVWIYHSDTQTVESRAVKTGAVLTDGTVTVTEGLQAGETVVTAGVHSLHGGERVKLLPAVSPSNIGGML
ncbi:MAG: efflux RND transporter periplasmic adaptor subunit [Prevotellaceae bacterium]|jgi:RND family efflux transporter MFP subunit|nr:efflux RND transporter periplasmic adaptor subunit [Prevotellaceae bacterium]